MHRLKEIFIALAALLTAGLMTGCVYDDYSAETPLPEEEDNRQFVSLFINVGMASPTRADAPAGELMHSLRIILVDAVKNQIEYNTFIGGLENATEWSSQGPNGVWVFRTEPGKKKIFFIANEDCTSNVNGAAGSLTAWLNGVEPNKSSSRFEDDIRTTYFTPDFDKGLVLSSSYEFEVNTSDKTHTDENNVYTPDTFYLVHNATKFEFEFVNNRYSDVRIDALSLSSVASNMYLLAHFDNNQSTEQRYVEWTQNGVSRREYWIDWLREVSNATQINDRDPENEVTNSTYGWITDYLLPANEQHSAKEIIASSSPTENVIPTFAATGRSYTLPTVYCSESKNMVGQQQEYRFSVTLTDLESKSTQTFDETLRYSYDNGETKDNLVTLFRNTHVKVRATLDYSKTDFDLHLHVVPWQPDEREIWDYVDHVTVQQQLTWAPDSYESINDETGELVLLLDNTMLEGTFNITAPINGKWYARLTPIDDARPNAVTFADENGDPMEPNAGDPAVCAEVSGIIDLNAATIRIRPTNLGNDYESRFRLEFFVENLGMWMTVPIVDNGKQFNYYTIVRKGNIIE